ncbi:B12-binding domain-containing radical SAM protein [Roseovarius sp. 2305UL8-3]|uniref:B12-binding domain-containing radical SAM protein n=1 Tax=Roseovarius conchicola TaxID=3121636 RepID=UPI00352796D1
MLVFLADLAHTTRTVVSDSVPYGIGNLATYASAYSDVENLEIRLFRDPFKLRDALINDQPDVLGLSNFTWNFRLSLEYARFAKEHCPAVVTLMGGPNFPLDAPSQERVLRNEMASIDVNVVGNTYEGEAAFLNLVNRLGEQSQKNAWYDAQIDGCIFIHPETKLLIRGGPVPRIRNLDEIPSPYLSGLMDEFLALGLFPKIQLVRGCPFGCTFCNSSPKTNNKAFRYSLERLTADLHYIAERTDPSASLNITDDNFAMYKDDEDVARVIADLIETYDWPPQVRASTGKNNATQVLKVADILKGRITVTGAVQSLDPKVLENIDRKNIRLEDYADIQNELTRKGHYSTADLIVGLPGETFESLTNNICTLLDAQVQYVAAHQLVLADGSILATPAERSRFDLETKFRIQANSLGEYGTGRVTVETQEVVVSTDTLTFAEQKQFWIFHNLVLTYWSEKVFEEAFELSRAYGISTVQIFKHMYDALPTAPDDLQKVYSDLIENLDLELFDSHEACIKAVSADYDYFVESEQSGNPVYNSMVKARFFNFESTLTFLISTISRLLPHTAPNAMEEITSVHRYLQAVAIVPPFGVTLDAAPAVELAHDVMAWREDGFRAPLSAYRFDQPRKCVTSVDPKLRTLLLKRAAIFGETPEGIGRLSRSWFANMLRREIKYESYVEP